MTSSELLGQVPDLVEQLRRTPPCGVERRIFEVKGWCYDEKDLWKETTDAAVCLANTDGGIILVGLDDKQLIDQARPCPHSGVTPEWLRDSVSKFSHPAVECSAHWLREIVPTAPPSAKDCIVLVVPRKTILGVHRTHRGVCLIRHGDNCDVDHLTSEDDYTNIIVEGADVSALSNESLHLAFTKNPVRPRVHARWRESQRATEDLLVDFNLVRPEGNRTVVKLAAVLLFGRRDFLSRLTDATFLRVTSVDPSKPYTEPYTTEIRGNISDTLREIWTRQGGLAACLGGILPERCLQELVVNALIHRSYRSSGPINVRVSPDHLFEIQNPGGFLRNLNPQNLINASPVHRNRLLTEAVALLGFCEKSGSGIDIVYEEAVASGHDFPYFDGDAEAFSAIVPLQRDTNFAKFVRYRGKDFSKLESLLVVRHLYKAAQADVSQLARVIQRPEGLTESLLHDLVRRLVLKQENGQFGLSDGVRYEIENPLDRNQRTLFDGPR